MNEAENLSNLLDWITKTETKSVNDISDLLSYTADNYSPHKDDVIKQYDLTREAKFNIFETISDLYTREKFHSDILFTILDSNTPEIGTIYNKEILEEFVKMVDNSFDFIVDNTVKVFKEKSNVVWDGKYYKQGYIDLLITNANNQAIIIENKINYAPDMDNQLVRYMKYVKEQEFGKDMTFEDFKKNVRVVYLTLVPGKIPNIYEYGDSFAEYKEMLSDAKSGKDGAILKYRSAVDYDKDKTDLVTFLNNCIKLFAKRTDDTALLKKVYIEQYKTLLSHLGGSVAMLEYQKKLLEHIYSSKENLEAARDIVKIFEENKNHEDGYKKDVWNEINSSPDKLKATKYLVEVFNFENYSMEINIQYINDCLKPFLENKEMGFTFEDNWLYKVWNKNNTVSLYVTGQWGFQIGFEKNNGFTEKEQEKYEKILEDIFKTKPTKNNKWVWLVIVPLADKNNMKEFLEYCTSFIPQVKEEFLAL